MANGIGSAIDNISWAKHQSPRFVLSAGCSIESWVLYNGCFTSISKLCSFDMLRFIYSSVYKLSHYECHAN